MLSHLKKKIIIKYYKLLIVFCLGSDAKIKWYKLIKVQEELIIFNWFRSVLF